MSKSVTAMETRDELQKVESLGAKCLNFLLRVFTFSTVTCWFPPPTRDQDNMRIWSVSSTAFYICIKTLDRSSTAWEKKLFFCLFLSTVFSTGLETNGNPCVFAPNSSISKGLIQQCNNIIALV